MAGPWARDAEQQTQYKVAAGLLGVGVVLWAVTWLVNRREGEQTGFRDSEKLGG